jgi:7-carboxy-7-deazaguanine synthase (Cx14CxxC type)
VYSAKEIFYTLQGEGAQSGRPAVFLRFAGCNLWSGREADRASAACNFCDTDFVGTDGPGGGKFATAHDLAQAVCEKWPVSPVPGGRPFVVATGGEPLLQLDEAAIAALHENGFEVAVESNGTVPAPRGIDWLCVSPKSEIVQTSGDELKLVYPQPDFPPEKFAGLAFRHFFLSPMDGPELRPNTDAAVAYCLAHPQWRLSVQLHKILGIP